MKQLFHLQQRFPDMEPAIYRHRCFVECLLNQPYLSRAEFGAFLQRLSAALGMKPHPEQREPIITSATGHTLVKHAGLEAMLFWLESGLHAYWWEQCQLLTIDMHSCAYLDGQVVEEVTNGFFDVIEYAYLDLTPENSKADNRKISIRPHEKFGAGVIACADIAKDEFISGFYGAIYEAESALAVPAVAVNHALQFAERKWRDGLPESAARYLNHSCAPNCGVKGLFDLVALRDISAGEELCWDYAMTEDSNWQVPGGKCLCGASSCRGRIVPYRELSVVDKQRYRDYTSAWLRKKYSDPK